MPLFANTAPEPPPPNLDLLVRNLDLDTVRCKRLMRQFLEQNEAGFLRAAAQVLQRHADTPGGRYILSLLMERGLLIRMLCAPSMGKEEAQGLARGAIGVAPSTGPLLARRLTELLEAADGSEDAAQIARLVDLLAEVSDNAHVFPSIVRLLRHPNPHIRSKAVLMIGRRSRSAQWVRHRLADSDSRIRANALEALWDVDTAEARELLEALIRDPNNRVAGNAMLGLYRLGLTYIIPEILNLAVHESALFRSTAAWVMGESGDPRFTEPLAGLLRESNAMVRKRAFAALGRMRSAVAAATAATPHRLAARVVEFSKDGARLMLATGGQHGWASPDLLPTQILVSEDGRPVQDYRVIDRPLPETIFVIFLLPTGERIDRWRETALGCLPWKRPSDLWACEFYQPQAAHEAGAQDRAPNFQAIPENIRSELAQDALRFGSPDLWRTIRRAVHAETSPPPGKRQLIVFAEGDTRCVPDEDMVPGIAASQATLQIVSCGPNAALEDFCRRVNSSFLQFENMDQAAAATVHAYLHQVPRYEITWQPLSLDSKQLKVRVHGPSLCGETTVRIPAGTRG